MRWFRFYNDALNDPKVQLLDPYLFKAWVNILCMASRGDGKISNGPGLQFHLRTDKDATGEILTQLTECGLLDDKGKYFQPHNWDKWQYKSDVSNDRVKRYRDRYKTVTVTPPETESDTDTESKVVPLRGKKIGNSRKSTIPDDWKASTDSTQKAQKLGLSLAEIGREAEKFRNHARQNERKCVRWDSAFDNWCIRAAEFLNKSPPTQKTDGFSAPPGSPEFSAWRTFARDCGKTSLVRILDQREMEGRAFEFEQQWPPGVSHGVG